MELPPFFAYIGKSVPRRLNVNEQEAIRKPLSEQLYKLNSIQHLYEIKKPQPSLSRGRQLPLGGPSPSYLLPIHFHLPPFHNIKQNLYRGPAMLSCPQKTRMPNACTRHESENWNFHIFRSDRVTYAATSETSMNKRRSRNP